MSMELVLLLVCVGVTVALWWAVVACLERRIRPRAWWKDRDEPASRARRAVRAAGESPGPPPVLDTQMTLAWADPAQVWPALNAENALLAARMSGRLTPLEYRAKVADLARRCEPTSAADSE
ncbi:hypothetical protein [Nocardia pseudobrasiliensis]|uniref:Uncharacterized protein n=1 Tax=Nocardia pseudobrasiliensis TaxID=45979 RepID=A0A370HYD7_9NOCA|nr:hypothetical protein [Nocardia pseudobrasiliensis]RDI63512.1 hypothetical protein DFR76_110209 [Nocardia pseudobrasiliensis]